MSGQPDVSACPVCGHSDRSQPVQAVVDSQTTRSSGYGASLGLGFAGGRVVPVVASHLSSSTAHSPLAQMLDLPYPRRSWYKSRGRILFLVPLIAIFLAAGMTALHSMLGPAGDSIPWLAAFGMLVLITIMQLVLLFPLTISCIMTIIRHRREGREWRRKVERWQQARRVWITLRYCHRDHVVYSVLGVTIEPTMVRQFTYGQIAQQPAASMINIYDRDRWVPKLVAPWKPRQPR